MLQNGVWLPQQLLLVGCFYLSALNCLLVLHTHKLQKVNVLLLVDVLFLTQDGRQLSLTNAVDVVLVTFLLTL